MGLTRPAAVADCSSTCSGFASTATVSLTEPTSRVTFKVSLSATFKAIFEWTDFLKFGASATTSYLPTGKYAARYWPLASVVTVRRTTFLSRFLIVTLAPATAAPEESLTVPTIEPVISCAETIAEQIHRDTNTYSAREFLLMTPHLVPVFISPSAGADGSPQDAPVLLPGGCRVKLLKRFSSVLLFHLDRRCLFSPTQSLHLPSCLPAASSKVLPAAIVPALTRFEWVGVDTLHARASACDRLCRIGNIKRRR